MALIEAGFLEKTPEGYRVANWEEDQGQKRPVVSDPEEDFVDKIMEPLPFEVEDRKSADDEDDPTNWVGEQERDHRSRRSPNRNRVHLHRTHS
jgi:hypothetical protein